MSKEDEIAFAEAVHAKAHALMGAIGADRKQRAFNLAAELCTLAAKRHNGLKMGDEGGGVMDEAVLDIGHNGLKMGDEVQDESRFDLAALAGLPMQAPETRE